MTNIELPHHRWLDDGRLITWYHRESDDSVQKFMIGRDDIDVDEGLALLAANALRRNGELLGPVRVRPEAAIGQRARRR